MKKVLALLVFFLFVSILMKSFYYFTDGFRLNKIVFFTKDSIYEEEKPLDEKITNQNFFYLGKGRQSYVFESEDKKYVIKLIRFHKYQMPLWSYLFAKLHLNFEKQKIMLFQKEERKQRAYDSYLLAKNELIYLTHVNYLHLKKTHYLNKTISLYDAMKRKHILNLDDVFFIIQKKADSLQKQMLTLYEERNDEKLKTLISSYIDMVVSRLDKNIANRDYMNYVRNCGVIKSQVMEVDIGSFYLEDLNSSIAKKNEFERSLSTLETFINKKMPSYRHLLEDLKNKASCKL